METRTDRGRKIGQENVPEQEDWKTKLTRAGRARKTEGGGADRDGERGVGPLTTEKLSVSVLLV